MSGHLDDATDPQNLCTAPPATWDDDREFEIQLMELLTGISRVSCRIDPTVHGRNGEPQFPLGGQCGHDYAPHFLTDESITWPALDEVFAGTSDFAEVSVYREPSGAYLANIFTAEGAKYCGPARVSCRGVTRAEAIARTLHAWLKEVRR